jgi:hypothetical protein
MGVRGNRAMTVTPPEPLVTGGLRSLEVCWILPGRLEPAVAGWFARFPAEMAARQDAYLLDPELGGLPVKVRAGGQAWWSLGFEATCPDGLLRSALQAAAGQIFAQPLPGEAELGLSDCQSYAQWLDRRR